MFFGRTKEKGLIDVQVCLKDEPEGGFESDFQIKLTDSDDGCATGFEYLGPPVQSQPTTDVRILDALSDEWQTVSDIAAAINVTKPTVRAAMKRLLKLGVVEEEPSGQAKLYRREHRNRKGAEKFK